MNILLEAYAMTVKKNPSAIFPLGVRIDFWEDQGRMCHYCNKKLPRPGTKSGRNTQFDHVVSYADGGDDTLDNMVLCCRRCNLDKGKKTYEEFIEWNYRKARETVLRLSKLRARLNKQKSR